MKVSYKIQDRFDFFIFIPVLVLVGFGLLAIYSSTINHPTALGNFEKQLFWVIVSILALLIVYLLPPNLFKYLAVPSYILSQALLIIVLVFGKVVKGSRSWLSFGDIGFQPSEFAKIGLILFLAYWITNKKNDINNVKVLALTVSFGLIPMCLILLEPDTGTAIVYAGITLAMIFWGGISLFGLFVVLSPGVVIFASIFGIQAFIGALLIILVALILFNKDLFTSATIFVVNLSAGFIFDMLFKFLQPHQQKRIEAFIDPNADPLGSGYNALQAKVAIGSGGLLGKGFLEGNQTQLRFIPEQWTDFIYCVIGEEFGFIGSVLIIAMFLIIFLRLLHMSKIVNDQFGNIAIIGIFTLLLIHFVINIGMNVGLTPVIGLPLPFLSYGGSSLLVNMILIGIVLNIYKHKRYHS